MLDILLAAAGVYTLCGVLFGFVFAFAGAAKMDPAASGGSLGFKLVIIPGCVVFWPLLLARWLRGRPTPTEHSAHRDASSPPRGAKRPS